MVGITKVTTSGLFWETLAERRSHARYASMRQAIDDLVARKAQSTAPAGKRDKLFGPTNKYLRGIWHASLCWEPDTVLFYTLEGTTLHLAMLGSHKDYPSEAAGLRAAERTANRIRASLQDGHVHSPRWKNIDWKKPIDLVGNPELAEADHGLILDLIATLRQEAEDGRLFRRLNGYDLTDADEVVFDAWFNDVEAAHSALYDVLQARPVTGEERVAQLAAGRSAWAKCA